MQYIVHRINTRAQLEDIPPGYGVELDLRDRGDDLILAHDPFQSGEHFADYLAEYRHGLMILNIKSERIEHRVLEMIEGIVPDYFFLDSSYPMIRSLCQMGESKIAVRYSEFEPIESALALAGDVQWAWIDCFTKMPLTDETYAKLETHFKLCIVSPELQGRSVSTIAEYAQSLIPYPVDAICTKRPDLWQAALGS